MPPLIGDHAQAINLMITADVAVEEDTILGHPALSAITIIITRSMMTIAIPDPGPQHNNQGQTWDRRSRRSSVPFSVPFSPLDAFTLCPLPDDSKVPLFQFNQCLLDTDPLQTETLLQPHQARAHGVLVDDCTKQHPSITGQPATQCIQIGSDKFEMYFYGWKTYFRVQKPTSSDLVKYPIYEIATSRLYSPQCRRHTRRSKPATKKDVDIDLWWAHLGYPTFEVTEATTIANTTTQMIQTLQSETRE